MPGTPFPLRYNSGRKKGDVNGDGDVDVEDMRCVISALNGADYPAADVNGDGRVDVGDILTIAGVVAANGK